MADPAEFDAVRPAMRQPSRRALWTLCATALGGLWLLHQGASALDAAPVATRAETACDTLAVPTPATPPASDMD